jgi:hypothetical protein
VQYIVLTLTTTTGVVESSASHIVLIDDGPPSTKTITIGISVYTDPSTVCSIYVRLAYISISARNGRTCSGFAEPSSNNKKCV